MKSLFALIFLLATTTNYLHADTKAKAILDELSTKTKSYSTIKAEFTFSLVNKKTKMNELQKGKVMIKKEKYKIELTNQEILCDGKKIYTILKDAKEIQVNDVNQADKEAINPSNIFTIYESGFKYKYQGEEKKNNSTYQIIELYPKNPKEKDYTMVRLMIDKDKKQIAAFKISGKNGNEYNYLIDKFTPNAPIDDSTFLFNKNNYPGMELVD